MNKNQELSPKSTPLSVPVRQYGEVIRTALLQERIYSRQHGLKAGQYWLHRRITQITEEAEDHFLQGEETAHFPG